MSDLKMDCRHARAARWQLRHRIRAERSQDDTLLLHRLRIVKRRPGKSGMFATFDTDDLYVTTHGFEFELVCREWSVRGIEENFCGAKLDSVRVRGLRVERMRTIDEQCEQERGQPCPQVPKLWLARTKPPALRWKCC